MLVFLSLGEVGMRKIGVKTRCLKLIVGSGVSHTNVTGNKPFYKMLDESPSAAAFEMTMKANGKGMSYVIRGAKQHTVAHSQY